MNNTILLPLELIDKIFYHSKEYNLLYHFWDLMSNSTKIHLLKQKDISSIFRDGNLKFIKFMYKYNMIEFNIKTCCEIARVSNVSVVRYLDSMNVSVSSLQSCCLC